MICLLFVAAKNADEKSDNDDDNDNADDDDDDDYDDDDDDDDDNCKPSSSLNVDVSSKGNILKMYSNSKAWETSYIPPPFFKY